MYLLDLSKLVQPKKKKKRKMVVVDDLAFFNSPSCFCLQ